ncbi:cell division cycle-associated protein 3 [Erinaceus europaeus]|uniref:Cell division cycle-associated protein 3 n=1 Tax=Erinaceus europaeus TaxID=9365 RepID=A0A1S3ALC2_ERIEU|nr:cell division cycle-associated protein 3 [Erinaceus europaeus]XP_060046131.1 cell division cycle-associated protein 3 [Erinaceus europaeus]
MGSAKSVPATPARAAPHNKHLARVADPRSPSAGILRTPIQVESSPQPQRPAGEPLEGPAQAPDSDPRSPTLGIARTPMKISGDAPNPLVKQLDEEFGSEASNTNILPEPVLPLEALSSSELDLPLDTQCLLQDQVPSQSQTQLPFKQAPSTEETALPSETPVTSQGSGRLLRDSQTPRASGAKCNRRKPKGKVLGRSPLTVLQDDNSPGALTSRQGKRLSPLSENIRDLKDGTILGTGGLLKAGGRAWEQGQDQDKENHHFPLVEN